MDTQQPRSTDHDLLIEIRTTLGFLMSSMRNMEDKFHTKADQSDLAAVEARLAAIERKFWVGTGIIVVMQIVLTFVIKMLPTLQWVR